MSKPNLINNAPEGSALSFVNLIAHVSDELRLPVIMQGAGPLESLSYDDEMVVKNKALGDFWGLHCLPGYPEPCIRSPKPRHYRTTSKRKVALIKGRAVLCHADGTIQKHDSDSASRLEPLEHGKIFHRLGTWLGQPRNRQAASVINYIIIRGSYQDFMIIFNVLDDAAWVGKLLQFAVAQVHEVVPSIAGSFLFFDPTGSDYFLEASRPVRAALGDRKLHGYDTFKLPLPMGELLVSPFSFSQINQSVVPALLCTVKEMLCPDGKGRLLDLFCGYGLFAHFFGQEFREIVGIEASRPSVAAAVRNVRRFKHRARMHFHCDMITPESLSKLLPVADPAVIESVVIDPPRNGASPGVIAHLAARRPTRVVHLCCGIEEVPETIKQWRRCGYAVRQIVPVDMFAGTANLEIVILLEASR